MYDLVHTTYEECKEEEYKNLCVVSKGATAMRQFW